MTNHTTILEAISHRESEGEYAFYLRLDIPRLATHLLTQDERITALEEEAVGPIINVNVLQQKDDLESRFEKKFPGGKLYPSLEDFIRTEKNRSYDSTGHDVNKAFAVGKQAGREEVLDIVRMMKSRPKYDRDWGAQDIFDELLESLKETNETL